MKLSRSQLFATTLLLGLSEAQSCNRTKYTNVFDDGKFNATGSVTFPAPKIFDASPETNWTWSSYVGVDYNSAINNSRTWTAIGLETSPMMNLTDLPTPYTGCLLSVQGLQASVLSRDHSRDNGSCNTVFSENCARAMIDNARNNAYSNSPSEPPSSRRNRCSGLLSSPPITRDGDPCDDQFRVTVSTIMISSNLSEVRTAQSGCPALNPGDSTAESGPLIYFINDAVGEGNTSAYDETLLNPTMLMSVIWKDSIEGQDGSRPVEDLVDVRMICIPNNITSPGSRTLSQAKAGTGVVSTTSSSFAILGSVAIGLLFGFVL